jgi:hypothetical protein
MAAGSPWRGRLAGWWILVPGFPQWWWRQRERALVLFGSYATALGVGLFAWGTWWGGLILALAVATHVVSAADAIRQGAFPGFGRWVPLVAAGFGVGLGGYGPALALAAGMAWPVGDGPDGYLVNRWAFRRAEPRAGAWIGLAEAEGRTPWIGRVVATSGQAVEWAGGQLRVAGEIQVWDPPRSARHPAEMTLEVPRDHLLVAREAKAEPGVAEAPAGGLVLVPRRQVLGRAWCRLYPVWSRRLLP